MTNQALIIFTKNPEVGKVKTRLGATIGDEAALQIYQQLLSHTANTANSLSIDKFVFYSDYIEQNDVWDNEFYFKQVQSGNDLGERMMNAFTSILNTAYNRVVIIGTDCPGLNADIIMNAFTKLKSHDVVIGPAEDGGYYLLGMKLCYSDLFENISWSTNAVFDETRLKCEALHLDYSLLPILRDIDYEEDLEYFKPPKND